MPQLNTYFYLFGVDPAGEMIANRNAFRVGLLIVNRGLVHVWLSKNSAITGYSTSSMRLLPNESLTLLKKDGDGVTTPLYAIAAQYCELGIVESVET